jgi:DNA (cytosine-5)-methyltransferase 1
MLKTLMDLGYTVQWAVINAADYGFPQRRRRVFIYASKISIDIEKDSFIGSSGDVFSRAFPGTTTGKPLEIDLSNSAPSISDDFNVNALRSPFAKRGYASLGRAVSFDVSPAYEGPRVFLGDILEPAENVPEEFWISDRDLLKWSFHKGAKKLERVHSSTGFKYLYSEGPVQFPDLLDAPSRTILTAEGGASPSRFKHAVTQNDKLRRLLPLELERLNGFPDNWTQSLPGQSPLSDSRRAFFMGNALVVGVVERILRSLPS